MPVPWREGGAHASGVAAEGQARFKSLIYLRGDCGRHDGATAGRSGADSRWEGRGERESKGRKKRRKK